jgi:iron complex transport system substrate-binding protein
MSPSVTELVFALGQGERVVGVSQHTVHPPEAIERPRCGGFVNPNFERIMALKPDVVITQGLAREVTRFAEEHAIRCVTLEITDLDSIFSAISRIGRVLDCTRRAKKLRAGLRHELEAIRESVAGDKPVRTFVVIGREPGSLRNLNTVGPGSYLDDILRLANGKNVFDDLPRRYGTVNKESLVQRRPEAVIELHGDGMMGEERKRKVQAIWDKMSALPAVQAGRVCVIDGTYALIAGPRVVQLARDFARCLHPAPHPDP